MESSKGAVVTIYGHKTGHGEPGHMNQAFVLPLQVDTVKGLLVFRDCLNHIARQVPGAPVRVLSLEEFHRGKP